MTDAGNLYPINTEIYYTGDMANHSGRGFVKSFRENSMGRSMDIVLTKENGTPSPRLTPRTGSSTV